MKNLLISLAGAAFLAGAATVASAQTAQTQSQTQTQTNPNTKVYAYQKTTEPKKAAPSIAQPGNSTSEHLVGSVPFGSPKWWEAIGRTSGGDAGQ